MAQHPIGVNQEYSPAGGGRRLLFKLKLRDHRDKKISDINSKDSSGIYIFWGHMFLALTIVLCTQLEPLMTMRMSEFLEILKRLLRIAELQTRFSGKPARGPETERHSTQTAPFAMLSLKMTLFFVTPSAFGHRSGNMQ